MKTNYIKLIAIILTVNIHNTNAQVFFKRAVFRTEKFSTIYEVTGPAKLTKYKKIDTRLFGEISRISEGRDTLYFKFWDIENTAKKPDKKVGDANIVNSKDNGKTWAYEIPWSDKMNRFFRVPFRARVVTATTIPFRCRLKPYTDFEADFFSLGLSYLFVRGNTKYFHSEFVKEKQNYWGWGPFVAIGQQEIDSTNTEGRAKSKSNVASVSYGLNYVLSHNNLTFILAIGCDNAMGYNAKYWEENNFRNGFKPWIGFGIGLKLLEIEMGDK